MTENKKPHTLRVKLDRTMCDGFGVCAKHAPEYFSLDDWGYANLEGDGNIPEEDQPAVMRALMDCPAHAIMIIGDRRPEDAAAPAAAESEPDPKTEPSEAEWGFTR